LITIEGGKNDTAKEPHHVLCVYALVNGKREGGREGGRGVCTYIWVGVKDELEVLEEDVHDEEHGREDD